MGTAKVSFFNTESGKYEVLQADLGKLIVSQGAKEQIGSLPQKPDEKFTVKKDVKVLGEDILGPHRGAKLTEARGIKSFDLFALGAGPVLGVTFLFAGGFVHSRRTGSAERKKLARLTKAHKTFMVKIKKVKGAITSGDGQMAKTQLEDAFKEYLGDKFDLSSHSLTTSDMRDRLVSSGVSSESVASAEAILNSFDALNYGGETLDLQNLQVWADKLVKIVKEVDTV